MIIGFDGSRAFVKERTGTEHYSYQLLKHLLKIDHTNTYRVYLREAVDDPILKQDTVESVVIRLPRLWTQVGLAWQCLVHKPDVLFVPAHTMPVIRWPNLKTVVTIHDLGAEYLPQYHKFPQKLYLNRSTEYAVKHATRLIAVSQATKDDLIKRLKADPGKISVVHEGFDPNEFQPASETEKARVRQKYGLSRPYVLFVGTIQPRKNLEKLIEAFAQVDDSFDLVLAGKKGWLADEIYGAPKKYGVEERVRFIDYVPQEDIVAVINSASVFAYPSLFEGFGLPVLEAMSCGTPVVTSTNSSLPEVAGEAAVLVDPSSATAIADGINQVLTDSALHTKLVEAGHRRAEQFSWQETAQETLDVLESVGGHQ